MHRATFIPVFVLVKIPPAKFLFGAAHKCVQYTACCVSMYLASSNSAPRFMACHYFLCDFPPRVVIALLGSPTGHLWLTFMLGHAPVRVGWSADPFGHSNTMAYMARHSTLHATHEGMHDCCGCCGYWHTWAPSRSFAHIVIAWITLYCWLAFEQATTCLPTELYTCRWPTVSWMHLWRVWV